MKLLILISFLTLDCLWGAEIRSYEISARLLERVCVTRHYQDPFTPDVDEVDLFGTLRGLDRLGPVIKEAGFESRFLEGAGELRDCKQLTDLFGRRKYMSQSVYDVERERLIVKADLEVHHYLWMTIVGEIPNQVKTTLLLYRLPGTSLEDRSGFWVEAPEEAKLLRSVSWVSLPRTSSAERDGEGIISVESELQIVGNDELIESRLSVEMEFVEGDFSWKTGLEGVLGASWAQEVGSLDGQSTLFLVRRYDLVTSTGRLRDELVLKEEGGRFLSEERLQKMLKKDPKKLSKGDSEELTFKVPSGFAAFLQSSGKKKPVSMLLQERGIQFRKGDYTKYFSQDGLLVAKLDTINMQFLEGLIHSGIGPDPAAEIYLQLAQVEGDDFRQGKVLQKLGVPLVVVGDLFAPRRIPLPSGQRGSVTLGDDLAFKASMWTDPRDNIVVDVTLTEQGGDLKKASVIAGVVVQFGKPVVLQESVFNGKKKCWVATLRRKVFEEELDQFLQSRAR